MNIAKRKVVWSYGGGKQSLADVPVYTYQVTGYALRTPLANVTGLALTLDAGSTYAIDARVMFQTAATTTGIRLSQAVPAGATVVAVSVLTMVRTCVVIAASFWLVGSGRCAGGR